VDDPTIPPVAVSIGASPPSALPPREPPAPSVATWRPWMAPAALVGGLVLAAVGGLLIDIPALAFGVNVSSSHVPPGLAIADTVVQDLAFVGAAVFLAQLGARTIDSSMFGLRPTSFWRAARLAFATLLGFLVFSLIWTSIFHAGKDKVLEQLGTDESAILLVLSAGLTCVVAPICEEFLFRGFIFTCLRNLAGVWPAAIITGLLFGGVHASSAPVADLVPLAGLGFGLCLLYRATGSLYPCIAAHAVNNSLAFGVLEDWGWQIPVLMVASLALIALLALALTRAGVITPERRLAAPAAFTVTADG
jgi:membrane protease YdiL (CAAX protease family)